MSFQADQVMNFSLKEIAKIRRNHRLEQKSKVLLGDWEMKTRGRKSPILCLICEHWITSMPCSGATDPRTTSWGSLFSTKLTRSTMTLMISCRTIKLWSRSTWIKKYYTTPMALKLRSSEATNSSMLRQLFSDHLRRWQIKILLHIASQLSQTRQETHLNSSRLGSSIPVRQGKSKSQTRDKQRTKRSHPPQ